MVRRLDAIGEIDGRILEVAARPAAAARALDALARSARELEDLAAKLRADGRTEEADILDAGMMMADDPVLDRGLTAASAIRVEVEAVAAQLDLLGDPELAARAADVRSLARRASRLAPGYAVPTKWSPSGGAILVASDLGPADVIEPDGDVRGIALGVGGVTGHAAIVARGLDPPIVVGLGADVLALPEGEVCIVDGDRRVVVASPHIERLEAVRAAVAAARAARARAMAARALPTVTRDGRTVRVLANAATPGVVQRADSPWRWSRRRAACRGSLVPRGGRLPGRWLPAAPAMLSASIAICTSAVTECNARVRFRCDHR